MAAFSPLPARTILFIATSELNEVGMGTVVVTSVNNNPVIITMDGFKESVGYPNLDFYQGLEGWKTENNDSLSIVPYQATVGPVSLNSTGVRRTSIESPQWSLSLGTHGLEERQHASHTFTVTSKSFTVGLKWVFVTEEVPGGYYGSQYNDQFGISIRSQKTGKIEAITHSMNGLGLDAFDYKTGTTSRQPMSMTCDNPDGQDVIQLDLWVDNVGDGAVDSSIIVDSITVDGQVESDLLKALKDCNTDRKYCAKGKNPEPWDKDIQDNIVRSNNAAEIREKYLKGQVDLLDRFNKVALEKNIPVSLLLALASRESAIGGLLGKGKCGEGWGDFQPKRKCNNTDVFNECWGYGILQLDKCYHKSKIDEAINTDKHLGYTILRAGADTFLSCLKGVQTKFAGGKNLHAADIRNGLKWTPAYILKGALVCYNSGLGNVASITSMDVGTANNDYGSDVVTEAMWFYNNGYKEIGNSPNPCNVVNTKDPGTCAGSCFTQRAQFVIDAINACFPGEYSQTTYVGHSDAGNAMDIWPRNGGGYKIKATGDMKTRMDKLAKWLMDNHANLKVSYMIFYSQIWNLQRDQLYAWADCTLTKRCGCANKQIPDCYDVTEGHFDHLHLSVL